MFRQWADIEACLAAKGLFHIELGLGRMREGISLIGLPPCPVIQVLGTNGKGSTSAFLASLGRGHGLKTGLFTSPHFVSVKERVLVNGQQADAGAWLAAANELAARAPDLLPNLTYFEFLTLAALILFKNEKVDLAIFEAGLGGKNDATSAIPAMAQCFAPIAMDHADIIGPSLADIARDKAAAIKRNGLVFSAKQYPMAANILKLEAERKNAAFHLAEALPPDCKPGLPGKMQYANAALALACFRAIAPAIGIKSDSNLEREGLRRAFIPGRLQIVESLGNCQPLILDGAHNPHAMQMLVRQMPVRPATVIFSALGDKDWQSGLGMLISAYPETNLLVPQLDNARAANANDIAAFAQNLAKGKITIFEGTHALRNALDHASGPALLCGSLYLLAEFYKLFPQYLTKEMKK